MKFLKNIETKIQDTINKEIQVQVEITFCRDNMFSVYGTVESVQKAVSFLVSNSDKMSIKHESTEVYDEDCESCAFFKF